MIIQNPSLSSPTPTPQQILAGAVDQQKQQAQRLWHAILATMEATALFIFACPIDNGAGGKFTAQDVFNTYASDGADLCKLQAAVAGMVKAYTGSAPQIPPSGITLTINPDGTVTVGMSAPVSNP